MSQKLPKGVWRFCAGVVERNCDNEPYASAIKAAEAVVGLDYADTPEAQANRQHLIEMVKANLVNRKRGDRESLNRKYGTKIDHNRLWNEKKRFCLTLAKELNFIESREVIQGK